ncbi:hypothetical protein [Curtobacterium flaccumfaciens]
MNTNDPNLWPRVWYAEAEVRIQTMRTINQQARDSIKPEADHE